MRVLLGVPHNPLTSMGGAEVHAKNLATKLRDRGHAVRVVCVDKPQVFSGSGTRRTQSSDGFAFEVLQLPEQRRNEGLGWIYDDAFARRAILDVAAEFQPDVFHMISGYLLSGSGPKALSEKGVPVVLTLADYYFLCPRLHRIRSNGELCIQSDYGPIAPDVWLKSVAGSGSRHDTRRDRPIVRGSGPRGSRSQELGCAAESLSADAATITLSASFKERRRSYRRRCTF